MQVVFQVYPDEPDGVQEFTISLDVDSEDRDSHYIDIEYDGKSFFLPLHKFKAALEFLAKWQ